MRKRACMRPGFGAVRRGADCKVAVQTDLQAVVTRALCCSAKLAVGKPLAENGKLKALAVAFDRMVGRLWVTVAQILRPESPIWAGFSVRGRLEGAKRATFRRPISRRHGSPR